MATSLPEDPGDGIYSKICFVCREEAEEGQEHSRNYGGIVCLSCRAFFRRSHQKSRMPDFDCRFDGKCRITKKNRRRCQGCRYSRCLRAGMKPELVLTDGQKKIRFRKIILKRKLENKFGITTNTLKRKSRGEKTLTSCRTKTSGKKKTSKLNSSTNHQIESLPTFEVPQKMVSSSGVPMSEPKGIVPKNIKTRVAQIVQKYKDSITHSSIPINFCEKMIAIHSGFPGVTLQTQEVLDFMSACSDHFKIFASLNREFAQLCKEDQDQLFARNSPLYVQMMIASFFNSANLEDQLKLISEYKPEIGDAGKIVTSLAQLNGGTFINFEMFNNISRMFRPYTNVDYFCHLIQSVKVFSLASFEHRAILAFVILFHCDTSLRLTNTDLISDVSTFSNALFESVIWPKCHTPNQVLISSLSKMAVFCSHNINWNQSNDYKDGLLQGIAMPYTREEESWLTKQFKAVKDAYTSVPIGDDIIEEFTMYSLGVPLSKGYLKKVFEVGLERVKRIFKTQAEFCELPDQIQNNLLAQRGLTVFAVIVAKHELCANGMEQLQSGFGPFELDIWVKKYQSVFNETKLKKVGTLEACSQMPVRPNDELNKTFLCLIDELRFVVQNSDLCLMSILLLVTKLTEDPSSLLSKLHSTYQILMKRRLSSSQGLELNYWNGTNDVTTTISAALEGAEKLANLMICMLPP